jgi:hypothetical protein
MSLVYRGGRPYYRESFRKDGRVTSRYVVSGDLALACARLAGQRLRDDASSRARLAAREAEIRDRRRLVRERWLGDLAAAEDADALLESWCGLVESVFQIIMNVV